MPTGNPPPGVNMPSAVVTALRSFTYSSLQKAFIDSNGAANFLFVDSDGSGAPQWFYGTAGEGGINPKGVIPSQTKDVIVSGTFSNGVFAYSGSNWKIRLERDTNGTPTATAYTV